MLHRSIWTRKNDYLCIEVLKAACDLTKEGFCFRGETNFRGIIHTICDLVVVPFQVALYRDGFCCPVDVYLVLSVITHNCNNNCSINLKNDSKYESIYRETCISMSVIREMTNIRQRKSSSYTKLLHLCGLNMC